MVIAAPALPGSKIREDLNHDDLRDKDKFRMSHPDTYWQAGLEHAEKIGLGTTSYELINI
jgi:uncharacterized Fe-S center protein